MKSYKLGYIILHLYSPKQADKSYGVSKDFLDIEPWWHWYRPIGCSCRWTRVGRNKKDRVAVRSPIQGWKYKIDQVRRVARPHFSIPKPSKAYQPWTGERGPVASASLSYAIPCVSPASHRSSAADRTLCNRMDLIASNSIALICNPRHSHFLASLCVVEAIITMWLEGSGFIMRLSAFA